jgi:hypothetical protein
LKIRYPQKDGISKDFGKRAKLAGGINDLPQALIFDEFCIGEEYFIMKKGRPRNTLEK